MLDLRRIVGWLSQASFHGAGNERVSGICTDSRSVDPGSLFVALRGDTFDAHNFVEQARASGAAAVLVERWIPGLVPPVIQVPDSRRALGEIARGWRGQFQLPLIAVTGSNGKTTVKEMIAAIIAASVGESARLATRGNLNNEVGVPLTLLRLRESHRLAVVELGMNHPGEIAWLSQVARPTIALVNNAQREHQEFLAGVEATARENGSVFAALDASGVAVFPGDDPLHTPIWRALAGTRPTLEFGLTPNGQGAHASPFAVSAEVGARPDGFDLRSTAGSRRIALAIDGEHNVRNALAAAACALAAGIGLDDIARGLERFRPAPGRLVRHRLANGATLIDDSYNANPDSVLAAIALLAARPAPRVLVLGDMGEVGDNGPAWHREVGERAARDGIEHLLLAGGASIETAQGYGPSAEHFGDDIAALTVRVSALATPGASVLVKGSRFMRMERVVQSMSAQSANGAH
ncbi:MAG: UDP-N-acetylmuramoyl-tripeptide--D-alanyl-D-alanine ligase [Betaproteobacteria bacterium]|nr:UDP-N-acetylmuramoyl-tripeptide--D-alanyl-D-alanine ligase [Betaproteobacteria bacterium]